MKLKKFAAACSVAGLLSVAGASHASIVFSFDPTGLGSTAINNASLLDQAPGSSIGINGVNAGAPLVIGTTITSLFQANLGSVQAANTGNLFSNGTGGRFFTFVAGFQETVIFSAGGGGTVTNSFNILNGGFFKMCAQTALGDNLAGTGFSCAGSGILSGTITGGNSSQTGFLADPGLLDQAGVDDWAGTQSVTSSGAAQLSLTIDFIDAGYFPDLASGLGIALSFVNASNITPFKQVDASRLFSSNGVANGNVVTNVGAINGITGPDFIFQSDANASFDRRAVPEPGTLALVGLALGAAGWFSRRRTA